MSYGCCSLPIADLMETCIDDVLRAPAVPTVTATDEAGASGSYFPPVPPGRILWVSLVSVQKNHKVNGCVSPEAAARLKQLELETSPLLTTPKNNINVNMAMNNQEDVVKLTEKCALNSTGSSPAVTPLCVPEELKSNILKAQAEAAALKVRTGRMGSNSSLTVVSRPDNQDSWDLLKPASLGSSAGASVERLAEDVNPSVPKMPSEPVCEATAPKVKAGEVDLPSSAPLSDNLIDFTDPTLW
ncbi:hypothetical protein F7725_001762 [Dissostichus mawsoni]|uniref:Uncharacterized protein n=1 Tax=Dissostichus mawsoni TaxID=36200 RepID=A0A7J5Y1F8_DISMA|nr:hypothetical protein F7725_001762 [Dissostichus mawsoni]